MEVLDNLDENRPVRYAGFWIRFVAYLIDSIALSVIFVPIFFLFFAPAAGFASLAQDTDAMLAFYGELSGFWMIEMVIQVLYFAGMESSKYQATLGKMAVGIIVTDESGNRISMGRAIGRFFAKILSGLIMMIGYIMAGFDSRKQALHDKLASTFVIYRD